MYSVKVFENKAYRSSFETVFSDKTVRINKIWGANKNNIWFVGNAGFLAYWDGQKVTRYSSPVHLDLVNVWGCAKDQVWVMAAGLKGKGEAYKKKGAMLFWNGKKWKNILVSGVDLNQMYSVHGSSCNDVWMVGAGDRITPNVYHWNGKGFQSQVFPKEYTSLPHVLSVKKNQAYFASYGNLYFYENETYTRITNLHDPTIRHNTFRSNIWEMILLSNDDVFLAAGSLYQGKGYVWELIDARRKGGAREFELAQDSEGNIWVASGSPIECFISKYDMKQNKFYLDGRLEFMPNNILIVDGELWLPGTTSVIKKTLKF